MWKRQNGNISGRLEGARRDMRSMECVSSAAGESGRNGSSCIWSRAISTFTLTVMAGALVACSMGFGELEVPEDHQVKNKQTGRTLLVDNQAETVGYGLYSYVLFESPPTSQTKPLYLAIISACLKEFPDLEGLAKKHRPESLNAIYIPVRRNIAAPRAEEILQHYSYERAQAILNRLSKIQKSGGPYLVSSLVPVSSGSGASSFLFQDLSAVHLVSNPEDQRNMVYQWVLAFVDRVSNPQPQAWGRATLVTFGDEMRDGTQIGLNHHGVLVNQSEFKRYVNVYDIVFPIPDNRTEQTLLFQTWNTRVDEDSSNHIKVLE